jgi:adhesin/invasin
MTSVQVNQILTIDEPPLVSVTPRSTVADGASTASVVVRPAKPDGTPLGPGATVTIAATAGAWQGPVVDVGDGSYTRTLVAPTAPALSVITVAVAGTPMALLPRVEFR